MRIVAFVPIKINSERLHMKNIRPFTNGKPLISYILKTLGQVKGVDATYVYCSSQSIRDYLPDDIRFLERDPYYDHSTTPFNEVLVSFAEKISADIYILAHATAPFISAEAIERGIDAVSTQGHDCALTVTERQEFIWKDGKPCNYSPDHIPRSQDLEKLQVETCGLYVYRRELILREKKRIGRNPYLIPVSQIEACDINTEEDFWLADAIYNYKRMMDQEV